MAYYVSIQTGSGLYADWHIPSVSIKRSVPLKLQYARKVTSNPKPGLGGSSVLLKVHSAPLESEEAKAWSRGQVPAP